MYANWGYDHRCATVRVPGQRGTATRDRAPDGRRCREPVHRDRSRPAGSPTRRGAIELDRRRPETGDGIESINTERRVAEHLAAALDDLVADTELVEAVGAELVANLVGVKRHEWSE